MKFLIICTSNEDRSPALEKYFKERYPTLKFKSAGINQYHCARKGNRYLQQEDIDWSDFIVFCEQIHKDIVFRNYTLYNESDPTAKKGGIVLELGHYERGNINDEYLQRAEIKLKPIFESNILSMENQLPVIKTIEEAARYLHTSLKGDVNFAVDIKSLDANDFALSNHHSLGRYIRNSFGLWKSEGELRTYCASLGLKEPDDMSHIILVELHKLATAELNGFTYEFSGIEKKIYPSMNIFALHGHKVKVTSDTLSNGDDNDVAHVLDVLNVDYEYTVDATKVNDFKTEVYLKEREGIAFNSVNFADVHPQPLEKDQRHPDYATYNS